MTDQKVNGVHWCNSGWLPVHYGFCSSKKDWNRFCKSVGVVSEYPHTTTARVTHFIKDHSLICVVTLRKGIEAHLSLLEIMGLLTHEAVHVWQEMQENIGEDKPGREMEAYAIQVISQELLECFLATRGVVHEKAAKLKK